MSTQAWQLDIISAPRGIAQVRGQRWIGRQLRMLQPATLGALLVKR